MFLAVLSLVRMKDGFHIVEYALGRQTNTISRASAGLEGDITEIGNKFKKTKLKKDLKRMK